LFTHHKGEPDMTAVLKHTAELATPQATPTVSPQHASAQMVAGHATASYIAGLDS